MKIYAIFFLKTILRIQKAFECCIKWTDLILYLILLSVLDWSVSNVSYFVSMPVICKNYDLHCFCQYYLRASVQFWIVNTITMICFIWYWNSGDDDVVHVVRDSIVMLVIQINFIKLIFVVRSLCGYIKLSCDYRYLMVWYFLNAKKMKIIIPTLISRYSTFMSFNLTYR